MLSATSRWSDLVLITFEAPDELLRRHLPHPTLELDRWQGHAHVTVVALEFGGLAVSGMRVPAVGAFAQINLRIPVRCGAEAGVVFVRELVPNPVVASLARAVFRQPYATLPITRIAGETAPGRVTVEYVLDHPPRGCIIAAGSAHSAAPPPGSFEYHVAHRLAGFGTLRGRRLARFRVDHPVWPVRDPLGHEIRLDFGGLFGDEWRFLNDRRPAAVTLAVGSDVVLYPPQLVTDSTSTTP